MAQIKSIVKIKVIRRVSRREDGLSPILFEISGIENNKPTRKYITTDISCLDHEFDSKNQVFFQKTSNSSNLNLVLLKTKKTLNDIVAKLGIEATPTNVIEAYYNSNFFDAKSSFLVFSETEFLKTKKDYSAKYIELIEISLKTIKEYIGIDNDLSFEQINFQFLTEYKYWLEHTKQVKQNTTYQHLAFIRKFLNIAISRELTQNYPFKTFKFKAEKTDIEYLTIDELNKFQLLFDSKTLSRKLQTTLFHFLFSCYTGFRKDDETQIVKNINNYIIDNAFVFKTKKRKKQVRIPLNPNAINLISLINEVDFSDNIGQIKLNSNRVTNDLTEIIAIAKIRPRKLTFHCSRHTFATTCLSYGIPIEFISEWLGHEDIKTTQRYSKINLKVAAEQMSKWQ